MRESLQATSEAEQVRLPANKRLERERTESAPCIFPRAPNQLQLQLTLASQPIASNLAIVIGLLLIMLDRGRAW